MALFLEDLSNMVCANPDCTHKNHSGSMYIHSKCHPEAPTWVRYDRDTAMATVICVQCEREIAEIAIAARGDDDNENA